MVGHVVAPIDRCTVVITPFGKFVCNSTSDFFTRYYYPKKEDKIVKHLPRIYEELEMIKNALYEYDED